MPLILPHPITPTLTAAFSLMVAPFSTSAFQRVSTRPVGRLSAWQAFSSTRPEHAAFDYLFGPLSPPSSRSGLRGRGPSSSAYRGRCRGWSRSPLRTHFAPGWARRRRRTSRVRGPPNHRRRRARTSYCFLSCDLLHGDLAVFEGRGITGVYDAGTVQAVLPVLALPGTFPDGLDEALDNGVVSFAGFDLWRYDGGHAGHVGVDTDGIAGAVVPHLHLRSTVGAVKGDAEVVARLAVGGPAGLQVQRCPTG